MNATVVLEKMPECVINEEPIVIDSDSEFFEDEEVPIRAIVHKKITKGKPKLKKQTLEEDSKVKKTKERASSVEIEVISKVVEKAVGKSRKRPVDKDASESSKSPTSPVSEPPKRNRRALSVDALSKVSKTRKDTVAIEDEKKNKKGTKKDKQKLPDKSTKPKKTAKKVLEEEKQKSPTGQNIDEPNNLPGKPKSKRGTKKNQEEVSVCCIYCPLGYTFYLYLIY